MNKTFRCVCALIMIIEHTNENDVIQIVCVKTFTATVFFGCCRRRARHMCCLYGGYGVWIRMRDVGRSQQNGMMLAQPNVYSVFKWLCDRQERRPKLTHAKTVKNGVCALFFFFLFSDCVYIGWLFALPSMVCLAHSHIYFKRILSARFLYIVHMAAFGSILYLIALESMPKNTINNGEQSTRMILEWFFGIKPIGLAIYIPICVSVRYWQDEIYEIFHLRRLYSPFTCLLQKGFRFFCVAPVWKGIFLVFWIVSHTPNSI